MLFFALLIIFNQQIAIYENISLIKIVEFLLCCYGFYYLTKMLFKKLTQEKKYEMD
jgi:hypothetical protein